MFNLAPHSCTEKIVFTLLCILSFGEPYQEIYDHLLEAPVTREQLNHYRNVAENAQSELAATLVKFECAQSEVRLCTSVTGTLASCRAERSTEAITDGTVGHRFKPSCPTAVRGLGAPEHLGWKPPGLWRTLRISRCAPFT